MSELLDNIDSSRKLRWQLLTTVSVLGLIGAISTQQAQANGGDADRPTVWIELGAQLEQVRGFGDPVDPPFAPKIVSDGLASPLPFQRALSQSFGEEGAISFQPEDSDWVFSVSARYGRAQGGTTAHQQTPNNPKQLYVGTYAIPTLFTPGLARYSETRVRNTETHAVLDFQAGKDIGLGLFGNSAKSLFSFGVRFAQFTSTQTLGMNADPDYTFPTDLYDNRLHHVYAVASHIRRSFRGLGPSVSWNASAPMIGNTEQGALTMDWGANASVLFGRQKVQGHHQTLGTYFKTHLLNPKYHFTSHIHRSGNPDRAHTVTVPNLGGFAGLSYRFTNAKLSVGYRADFFFGAMDGGIDVARKETRGFYGPFATVSVGLGG